MMRKTIVALIAIGVLSIGAVAHGYMWGGGPGQGYQNPESQKFLDETAELRKALHEKMFLYREVYRAGDEKRAEALEGEILRLREQLSRKAEAAGLTTGWGRGSGRGRGAGPGYGYGCPGPYGR